jgi:Fic family protein
MARYIHQRAGWPEFTWDRDAIATHLAAVRHRQGRILGRMENLGFPMRDEAMLQSLTLDVLKSSEIEGDILSPPEVRSSIARRLGLSVAGLVPSDRHVDGVVQMTVEVTKNFMKPLTSRRLFTWHKNLFSGLPRAAVPIRIGAWRDDARGPMQVVSGAIGRERVHFEAPDAGRVAAEMDLFFHWANHTGDIDPVLKAAIAHLRFVTIHPFEDGNGRIARAVTDWALARSEESARRVYSMSAQIRDERKSYYDILEKTQKGPLDITGWLTWFLACLDRAFTGTETVVATVLKKEKFWKAQAIFPFNDRQRLILNKLLEGAITAKLTSSRWAKIARCSQDTAARDIVALIEHGILRKDAAGGRSTSYSLRE